MSPKQVGKIASFFCMLTQIHKRKNNQNLFGCAWAKCVCGHSGLGNLKLTASEEFFTS